MAKKQTRRISIKQVMIDKSNSRMVLIAGVAAFVTVFSLVASKSLYGQLQYQNKVIGEKKETLAVMKQNLVARDSLVKSYNNFIDRDINIIGGSSDGQGNNNGDNAKIITDALPFEYDFPALATSLEKIIGAQGLAISSITGTDDTVQQELNVASASPVAIPIPFDVQVNGSYDGVQKLILDFQHSIRPFVIGKLSLSSSNDPSSGLNIQMALTAQTYYQPSKELKITKEVVK